MAFEPTAILSVYASKLAPTPAILAAQQPALGYGRMYLRQRKRLVSIQKMKDLNKRVLKSTGRHLVTLSCIQSLPGNSNENLLLFSGFIVEISGKWLYITAGHILKEIQTSMKGGAKFDVWRLSDYTAGGEFKEIGIPILFDIDHWIFIEDSRLGLDFAALPLSDLYRSNLEAGEVMPIPHGAWQREEIESKYWVVVGVPCESVTYDGKTIIDARVVMVTLEPTNETDVPGEATPHKFYARLHEKSKAVVNSVEGMSGSPIFAFNKSKDDWEYVVIGVQSGWCPNKRIITACSFSIFANALEEAINNSNRVK